jgi:hypothetical protein
MIPSNHSHKPEKFVHLPKLFNDPIVIIPIVNININTDSRRFNEFKCEQTIAVMAESVVMGSFHELLS